MLPSPHRLSIDQLVAQMQQTAPAALTLDRLQTWLSQLHLAEAAIDRLAVFSPQGYQRHLLCRSPQFDLLLLCWQPGQASTIHDHSDSLNATRVLRGTLTSRLFALRPDAPHRCCLQTETTLTAAEIATVDRDQIHQLANTSPENLITLHLYARPLHHLRVYCPNTGRSESVPVQLPIAASPVAASPVAA